VWRQSKWRSCLSGACTWSWPTLVRQHWEGLLSAGGVFVSPDLAERNPQRCRTGPWRLQTRRQPIELRSGQTKSPVWQEDRAIARWALHQEADIQCQPSEE
jgi:hypothetical protein